jgi:hypothetical protein
MNSLPDLVRESLSDLTQAAEMPPEVGERAMVAGRHRRRRRAALVGVAAVAAAAALVLPFAVLGGGKPPAPAMTGPENVLFAVRHTRYLAHSDKESDVHRWQVLDPATGEYRDLMVKKVSEPTTDLRYAAVLPKGDGAHVLAKLGRYETTTGALRWYDIPIRPDVVAISPDGRYAAAMGWDDTVEAADVTVVDLETGQVRRFNTAPLYEATEPPGTVGGSETPPEEVAWAPDSRHLLFGAAITDLDGRRTGEVVRPADTGLVSVHRGGAGTLVKTGPAPTDYALVDGTGALRHRTRVGDRTCEPTLAPNGLDRCRQPWARFVSWRGAEQILIQRGPAPNAGAQIGSPPGTPAPREEVRYEVLDLRTGRHEAVSVPHFDGDGSDGDIADSFVVISADGLSPAVRDRVAF